MVGRSGRLHILTDLRFEFHLDFSSSYATNVNTTYIISTTFGAFSIENELVMVVLMQLYCNFEVHANSK